MLNRLLSVLFFARFGQITIYLLVNGGQLTVFPVFYRIFTPFYYVAPACFYLYIACFINDRSHFRRFEWLHFVPAILAVINVLPWHSFQTVQWEEIAKQISENKQLFIAQRTGIFPAYFYYMGRLALLLGYLYAAWHLVLTSPVIREKGWDLSKKWLFFFLGIATSFKLLSLLPLIFSSSHQSLVSPWFIVVNCLVLLIVILFILHQPRLLYGYLLVSVDWKVDISGPKEPVQFAVIPSPKINLLPEQLMLVYTESMEEFMDSEKPFLLPDFKIAHLSQKLNIPVHHCSYAINNVIGKNFRDWINAYRIRDFIINYPLLAENMTIEAIAYKSGFKSVATFYNAFKKETGQMPTAYFLKKEKELV